MSKNYEAQLLELINGLDEINKIIHNPKTKISYSQAVQSRHIQEARIQFFKLGYKCRDKEVKEQRQL